MGQTVSNGAYGPITAKHWRSILGSTALSGASQELRERGGKGVKPKNEPTSFQRLENIQSKSENKLLWAPRKHSQNTLGR